MTGAGGTRRAPAVLALLRDGWWACSAPASFFRHLEAQEQPRPLRAAGAAAASLAVAAFALALAFVRATASDAFLVAWALVLALALPYLALVLFLGGLVLVRPAALDLRAWEVAGWAWAPAGALGVSLLPATLVAPGASAAVGLAAFPAWHLIVVVVGLRTLAPGKVVAAASWYLGAVYLTPALLVLIGWAAMAALA